MTACQRLDGGVDGPLRNLAERMGAAAVLRRLNFSLLQAKDVGGMLSILGIERDQMNAALSSISDRTAPRDELAAVLWHFQHVERRWTGLLDRHALWIYLYKEHRAAFVRYVHSDIKQLYLPKEPSLLVRLYQFARRLWR